MPQGRVLEVGFCGVVLEAWELFGDESKSLMGQGIEGSRLLLGLIDHGVRMILGPNLRLI